MASIPTESGHDKDNYIDMNVLHAVQFDIEMFNYYQATLRKYLDSQNDASQLNRKMSMDGYTRLNNSISEEWIYKFTPIPN